MLITIIIIYRTKYFSVDPNKMIEMDRFVVKLDGSETQTLNIKSTDSHATMKDEGGSLEKYLSRILPRLVLVVTDV